MMSRLFIVLYTLYTRCQRAVSFFPTIFDSLIRLLNRLRQDARLAEDGHEIRVARPARDNVQVDVVWHARARRLADVRAEVEGVRVVGFL